MKIRMGFVSNSSSSSFLLYGLFIGGANNSTFEVIEQAASALGLGIYCLAPSCFDGCYVGLQWSSVGDNETGAEFKARVRKTLDAIARYIVDHSEEIEYQHDFPEEILETDFRTYWYS